MFSYRTFRRISCSESQIVLEQKKSRTRKSFTVFKMWLNRNGIANLLSIPQLEEDGYVIDYNTKRARLNQNQYRR